VTDGTRALCRAAQPGRHRRRRLAATQEWKVTKMESEATQTPLPELIACPEPGCGVPAGVVDRFVLASTSGPVEHVRTWCLNGHGYTQRRDAVSGWPMVRARRPLNAGPA
jgi:hypothetical protein